MIYQVKIIIHLKFVENIIDGQMSGVQVKKSSGGYWNFFRNNEKGSSLLDYYLSFTDLGRLFSFHGTLEFFFT